MRRLKPVKRAVVLGGVVVLVAALVGMAWTLWEQDAPSSGPNDVSGQGSTSSVRPQAPLPEGHDQDQGPANADAEEDTTASPSHDTLMASCAERRKDAAAESMHGMSLPRMGEVIAGYEEAGCTEVCGSMIEPPSDERCNPW